MSQYFVDNFFYEAHKNDLIQIDSGDSLNETLSVGGVINAAGGTFSGFNTSAPCKINITSMDPYPQIQIH